MSKKLLLILALLGLIVFPATLHAQDLPPSPASALSFFPVMSERAAPDSTPRLVPIANNHPLGGTHPNLTRVIIAIHDTSRNARGMLTILTTLAGPRGDNLLLLAPQFLIPDDVDLFYEDVPEILRGNFVTWPLNGGEIFANEWESGGLSYATPTQKAVSSFTVMDLILMYLGDKKAFPDLKEIIIAGHGAGANFIERYAAIGAANNVLEKEGIKIRYLSANPTAFLYFTTARPRDDSVGFAPPYQMHCDFNVYKYGLEKLNDYASHIGKNAIKQNFPDRDITYLMGEGVTASDPFPDSNCGARAQGPNRIARALSYSVYLSQLFGEEILDKEKIYTVPKTGYDPVAMFNTPCGMSVLFGDGVCPDPYAKQKRILQ